MLFCITVSCSAQKSQGVYIETGAGVNSSYFDVGAGTPGLSIHGGVLYDLAHNWKVGANIGIHRTSGTDEGTTEEARGYAFRSNLYEFAAKGVYVHRFNPYPRKRWKTRFEPRAFASIGIIQFLNKPNKELSEQNDGKYLPVAPFFSGGVGLAYLFTQETHLLVEGGANISTSDYLDGYSAVGNSFSPDYFFTLLVKLVIKIPSYGR